MTYRVICGCSFLLAAALCATQLSCEDPRPSLVRGTIANVDGGAISVTPLGGQGRVVTFTMDGHRTKIVARRVESGTMKLEAADQPDLVIGREVAITARGRHAFIVRVFPPKPVAARVVTVQGEVLKVSLAGTNTQNAISSFKINQRTKILLSTFDSAALRTVGATELKPGQRIFVYAQAADLVAVKIVPEAPTAGTLMAVAPRSLAIRTDATKETKVPTLQSLSTLTRFKLRSFTVGRTKRPEASFLI